MRAPERLLHWSTNVFLLSVVVGCSGSSNQASVGTAPEPPEAVYEGLKQDTIRQARAELERGEALAREGAWSEARLAFDRAVDLLLELPGGLSGNEEAAALYDVVIETIHDTERAHLAELSETTDEAEIAAVDELTRDLSLMESLEEPAEPTEADVSPEAYDIPIEMNGRVSAIIEMFQERRHDWFQEALDRSGHYLPMFHEIFEEEGLPRDLVYLAMVESAFKERAMSRAGARGIWQFIRGTGRLYGLKQDFWVDDRFDPEKATRAAARHLKDLYEEFEDWYLVMAAYNSGARRVERAIRRTGSRDFWTHARRRVLPRETRSYVPLILATIVIAKNPEAYGFTPSTERPREYDVVRLDYPVDLKTAAQSAGVSLEVMKRLNPELRRWVTPMDRDDYPLRVPKGSRETFRTALSEIPEEERVRFGTHVVRRGDSLSRIASRYGTSVNALVAANGIGRRSLIHPGQVLTVPVPPGAIARGAAAIREAIAEGGQDIYIVRRGDTLGHIAQSFRMSLRLLRELNDLPPNATRIYPGQRLVVSERPAPRRARRAPTPASGDVYVVRSGDTLGEIAEAHGLGLSVLRRLNGFSRRQSRIYVGQKLIVREAETTEATATTKTAANTGPVRYRIRRGDTLTTIARRFGVSVQELRRWNRMSSDRIVAGDSLTVYADAGTN